MICSRGGTEDFLNCSTSVLFSLRQLGRKSQSCKEEIRFVVSQYTIPCAHNFKPLFEFQTPYAQNYSARTPELIPFTPTWIYIEIGHYVHIVLLARNYPAGTKELFPLGANLDLLRNCTLHRIFFAGVKFRIYVHNVHYVEIIPLAQNSPAVALELFLFCANSDLRRNFTPRKNCPSGTSEFISFLRQLGSSLGVKIPRDSFSGIPFRFCWCLGIHSFWRQLGSSLEFSHGHLGINSVWRQLGLPLVFAIPGYFFSLGFLLGLPPWGFIAYSFMGDYIFSRLGFTILLLYWGTT